MSNGTATPRHILSLSGGKDSAALAIYLRDKIPNMEYVFHDTHKELPETYDYLDRVSDYLGRPVERLSAMGGFDHWYDVFGGIIPSSHRRWCTKMLKLKPFEEHVGNDVVYNYVGLRADEDRVGYISHKKNVTAVYPFRDDGLVFSDIQRILEESGVGMPPYTEWGRTRSGCFFCFYQQKIEWVRLLERHPDLYEQAMAYEHRCSEQGEIFTWSKGESLEELRRPERMATIKRDAEKRALRAKSSNENASLKKVFKIENMTDTDQDEDGCLICSL